MRKKSADRLTGNDRFEGFCVSLLDEIADMLGFNYTLIPIVNNTYGSKNPVTNEWNGMIRELIEQVSWVASSAANTQSAGLDSVLLLNICILLFNC